MATWGTSVFPFTVQRPEAVLCRFSPCFDQNSADFYAEPGVTMRGGTHVRSSPQTGTLLGQPPSSLSRATGKYSSRRACQWKISSCAFWQQDVGTVCCAAPQLPACGARRLLEEGNGQTAAARCCGLTPITLGPPARRRAASGAWFGEDADSALTNGSSRRSRCGRDWRGLLIFVPSRPETSLFRCSSAICRGGSPSIRSGSPRSPASARHALQLEEPIPTKFVEGYHIITGIHPPHQGDRVTTSSRRSARTAREHDRAAESSSI